MCTEYLEHAYLFHYISIPAPLANRLGGFHYVVFTCTYVAYLNPLHPSIIHVFLASALDLKVFPSYAGKASGGEETPMFSGS